MVFPVNSCFSYTQCTNGEWSIVPERVFVIAEFSGLGKALRQLGCSLAGQAVCFYDMATRIHLYDPFPEDLTLGL